MDKHREWTLKDMQRSLRANWSQYLGVCFDFSNKILPFDDPMEVMEGDENKFQTSDFRFGTGFLNCRELRSCDRKLMRSSDSRLRRLGCIVCPERSGRYLARTLKLAVRLGTLQSILSRDTQVRVEAETVRICMNNAVEPIAWSAGS